MATDKKINKINKIITAMAECSLHFQCYTNKHSFVNPIESVAICPEEYVALCPYVYLSLFPNVIHLCYIKY